jgi:hypothetical protein
MCKRKLTFARFYKIEIVTCITFFISLRKKILLHYLSPILINEKKLLLLLLFYSCLIQSQEIHWEKTYRDKHTNSLFDAHPAAYYGFILVESSLV